MVRLTRRGFTTGAIAIASAACGGLTTEDGSQGSTRRPPPVPGPSDPGFSSPAAPKPADPGLAFAPVARDAPPPSAIWSWTTAEQAAEIRRDQILFTKESSPTLGRGYLFDVLEQRAAQGDAAAARLAGTELATGRFGWTNPWATVRGATPDETYGLELLKIEMRPDTWFARVRTSRPEIDFVDAAGKVVDTATALASFERVGGILFENDVEAYAACSTGGDGGGMLYREIYVGNEARLATVSHRTAAILSVLDAHIAELGALGDWLRSGGQEKWSMRTFRCRSGSMWQQTPRSSLERYLASLAFATAPYAPEAANVDAIVTELTKARFSPDPFTYSP